MKNKIKSQQLLFVLFFLSFLIVLYFLFIQNHSSSPSNQFKQKENENNQNNQNVILEEKKNNDKTNKKKRNKEIQNIKEFEYPFDNEKYKKEQEIYFERLHKVPQIPINQPIDAQEVLNKFHEKIKNNQIFDENRIPYEFDFNILYTREEEIITSFTQQQIDDIIDYRLVLMRMYDAQSKQEYDKFLKQELYVEKLYKNFHTYPKRRVNDEEHKDEYIQEIPDYCNNQIDVVWTYVNGSEENWIKTYEESINTKLERARYRDYGTLKYSMRSVYENVPFEIHWHLIVQDEYQIPTFLDKSKLKYYNDESTAESLRIIYHKDIFPDAEEILPTFNSNAIESVMYRIKGLNECFIYLNDDFFINSPIDVSDVFHSDGRMKVYFNTLISKPIITQPKNWHKTITVSMETFKKQYPQDNVNLYYTAHQMYFYRRSVLKELHEIFKEKIDYTIRQHVRSQQDIVLNFLHGHYMAREGLGYPIFEHPSMLSFYVIKGSLIKNKVGFDKMAKKDVPFIVLNDEIKSKRDTKKVIKAAKHLEDNLEQIYPNKTPFEL